MTKNKIIYIFLIGSILLFNGCVSVSTGIIGVKSYEYSPDSLSFKYTYDGNFSLEQTCSGGNITKIDLIEAWGKPERIISEKDGYIYCYKENYEWVGPNVLIYGIIIPAPIVLYLPVAKSGIYFHFDNGDNVIKVTGKKRHDYFSTGFFYGQTNEGGVNDYYGVWFGRTPQKIREHVGLKNYPPIYHSRNCPVCHPKKKSSAKTSKKKGKTNQSLLKNFEYDLPYFDLDAMEVIVYTKEFAERFGLPKENITDELDNGMQAMKFYIEKEKDKITYSKKLNIYYDDNIKISYPENSKVGSRNLVNSGHPFGRKGNDINDWKNITDMKYYYNSYSFYDSKSVALVKSSIGKKKVRKFEIDIDEYYRNIVPGISYMS